MIILYFLFNHKILPAQVQYKYWIYTHPGTRISSFASLSMGI